MQLYPPPSGLGKGGDGRGGRSAIASCRCRCRCHSCMSSKISYRTLTAAAWAFNCSQDVIETVYGVAQGQGKTNITS